MSSPIMKVRKLPCACMRTPAICWNGHLVLVYSRNPPLPLPCCNRLRSPMPERDGMEEWAAKAGCSLLEGPDDQSQRDFLLYVMKKSL